MRIAFYLSVAYLALAVALIGLTSGCSRRSSGQQCFSIRDCREPDICFLGTCRERQGIQSVYVELTRDNGITQQITTPIDTSSYQIVALDPVLSVTGVVQAPDAPRSGKLFARKTGTLPGRTIVRWTPVDSTGAFALSVLPGGYDMSFVPYASVDTSNPATSTGFPPIAYGLDAFYDDATRNYAYPALSDLVTVSGYVRYSTAGDGIAQALVTGTGQDAKGNAVTSSEGVTDATGKYTLVFPPGTTKFAVSVRPDGNPLVPQTTVTVATQAGNPGLLQDIVLDASPISVDATVVDQSVPPAPVSSATVYFEGQNVGTLKASFAAQLTTDASGSIGRATLLPGDYTITVMPGSSGPYAIAQSQLHLAPAANANLTLTVGNKVHVEGTVTAYGGVSAVAAANVSLSLLDAPAPRRFSAQTDAAGHYALDIDPGKYELLVEPPLGSALPQYWALVDLSTSQSSQTVDVQLYRPAFLYGRVVDDKQAPVSAVGMSFLLADPSSQDTPLLVGVATTDSKGEFVVPLPTPNAN